MAAALPSALDSVGTIVRELAERQLAVFLDYDGTLTPIVARPDLALVSESMRGIIRELAACCTVAVISGRDLQDVRDKVGLDELIYAGSHGFDIRGPGVAREIGTEFMPSLSHAEQRLHERLDGVDGVLIEHKKFGVAIHYRLARPEQLSMIERVVDEVAAGLRDLRKRGGKKVFELQPDVRWDKGRAVVALLETLDLEGADALPLYIGDDATDEDAFRALQGRGIGIVVWNAPRPTAAQYSLRNPDEVGEFLKRLMQALAETD